MIKVEKKNRFARIKTKTAKGLSLVEIVTVLVISSLVVVAALRIFTRVRSSAAAVNRKLDKEDIADEILQRIAEDLDRLAVSGTDITATIDNKFKNGFNISRLIIESKYYDEDQKPQTFEKVTWQSDYDVNLQSMILYRSHGGLNVEDKMYVEETEIVQGYDKDKGLFVPLCWGMTYFDIVVPRKDNEPLTQWHSKSLPPSIKVSISFAEPQENFDGTYEIFFEDIITRTIALDRTRKIRFVFVEKDFTHDPNDFEDLEDDSNDIESEEMETEETEAESTEEEEIVSEGRTR